MVDDRCQPHQSSSACGRRARRQSGHGSHKRGLNSKIHLAVDAHGMPVRILITAGTTADCSQAATLIEGVDAQH
ncbi:transposase [Candidatus Methylomicrobium oryzae]|uniref:transposase n=1 Tax=Candidatus Methylomicrobium oryzae TaxID=2802053 RepID=UPI003F4F6A3D